MVRGGEAKKSTEILFLHLALQGDYCITMCPATPVFDVAPWGQVTQKPPLGIMLQFLASSQLCPQLKQSKLQQLFPNAQKKSGWAGVLWKRPVCWAVCLS